MAKPPFRNAKGQWEVDLRADQVVEEPDGTTSIRLETSDIMPGGALFGISEAEADEDGMLELVITVRPDVDTRAAKFQLRPPSDRGTDAADRAVMDAWARDLPGSGIAPFANYEKLASVLGQAERDLGIRIDGLKANRADLDYEIATGRPRPLEGSAAPLSATTGGSVAIPHAVEQLGKRGTTSVSSKTLAEWGKRKTDLQPTLSDELMFARNAFLGAIPRKAQEAIRMAHRTSRAFVFDAAASYRLGEICSYLPDLIADQQEFARCPYPRTWIEVDQSAFSRALRDAGLELSDDTLTPADDKFGFLITERGIYTASSNSESEPMWSPIVYRPHQPMTREQEERFCHDFGCTRIQIDAYLWGSAYGLLDPSRRRSLRYQHGVDNLIPADRLREPGALHSMLAGSGSGDLKVALCAALLLIRPNMTVLREEREPGRRMVHGRPTAFIAHRVVTIRLSADRLVSRIRRACKEDAGRARARWHEVRGHYMHNHRAKVAQCDHDWEEVEPLKWECRLGCGGRRSWRTYPEGRGDAGIGVVTKHYEVRP